MKFLDALILLLFIAPTAAFGSSHDRPYTDLREQLSKLDSAKNDEKVLAKLFALPDADVVVLARALDDPNPIVSKNAQIVLRYLGGEKALTSLYDWYATKATIPIAGPVSQPLKEWDFKYIDNFLKGSTTTWPSDIDSYIYALALDAGPKARTTLGRIMAVVDSSTPITFGQRAVLQVKDKKISLVSTRISETHKLELKDLFFVANDDLKYTTTSFIAASSGKDKLLFRVYINRGRLAEEWYHIVLNRSDAGWKYQSVTRVGVS